MQRIEEAKLAKISQVFAGKGRKTNMQILRILALEGPQTPYGLFKKVRGKNYSVINVRMRALAQSGHLTVVASEPAAKSQQYIKRYGLTLKGFILSLLLDKDVLDKDVDKEKEKRALYDGKVEQILNCNSKNVSFCRFFGEAIEKRALDESIVKDIFLDRLREYSAKGYINLDVIDDYFLFKHAGAYIQHFGQEQIDHLPKESRDLVGRILVDFRRLSHPETTSTFLKPYLDEEYVKEPEEKGGQENRA